jgi:hypothetical protein
MAKILAHHKMLKPVFMKYLSVILFFLLFGGTVSAQTRDTIPPYKKDLHIPNFSILQPDST